MEIPQKLRYTEDHEWVDDEGKVGITGYAQDALGDVVFVELPAVGRELKRGEAFGVVESVKSVSDLYSPVDGVVRDVNSLLESEPEKINLDPYGEGWIVRIEANEGLTDLMTAEDYRKQIGGE